MITPILAVTLLFSVGDYDVDDVDAIVETVRGYEEAREPDEHERYWRRELSMHRRHRHPFMEWDARRWCVVCICKTWGQFKK